MSISARLQVTPAANRRGWTRRSLSLVSSLQGIGEDVTIHDVSSTGLLVETAAELAVGDRLEIELPEAGPTQATVVWSSGHFYGCQFKERISQAAISAALLRSTAAPPSVSEIQTQLQFPEAVSTAELEPRVLPEDEKASLPVRLRVMLGSSIVLWALIIWAGWSFFRFT